MKGTEWEKIILQFLFHKLLLNDTYVVMVASHAATLRITYRYLHAKERVRLAQRPPLLRPKKLDLDSIEKKGIIPVRVRYPSQRFDAYNFLYAEPSAPVLVIF